MNCKQCNSLLENKREDALYCNHNCQQKYFKRKQKIKKSIKKLENEIDFLKKWYSEKQKELTEFQVKFNQRLEQAESTFKKAENKFLEFKKVLSLSIDKFKEILFENIRSKKDKYPIEYKIVDIGLWDEKEELAKRFLSNYENDIESVRQEHKKKLRELTQIKSEDNTSYINELKHKIETLPKEWSALEEKLKELININLDRLPPIISKQRYLIRKRTDKSHLRGYSGSEILKMKFKSLNLNGDLGSFLGKLQREKCAIALTGDSGAGKTTFSYQLARAFLEKNQKVAYFSLESGFTESMQHLIDKYEMNKYKFEAFGEGTLKDVRAMAHQNDCIIVDSYSKISNKAEDFENLRQDFPNTFFIIIFQKTTDGKIRGGSSILFNSTATIDIQITRGGHRIAFMKKSRYDSENFVYSLTNNIILKKDKTPIKWSEIEQRWSNS